MHMRPGPCPALALSSEVTYPYIRIFEKGGETKVCAPSRPRHTAPQGMIGPV